jgi:hypothetical protein
MGNGPLPVHRLRADFERWLVERQCDRGVCFYSAKEWAEKGETMADGAALHLVIEASPLFSLVNTYWDDFPGGVETAQAALNDLNDFLESRGYFYELGYAWSMHLYPISDRA